MRVSDVRVDVTRTGGERCAARHDGDQRSTRRLEPPAGRSVPAGRVDRREGAGRAHVAPQPLRRSAHRAQRGARRSGSPRAAELDVEIDSGPRFSIGPLEVRGPQALSALARRELQHPEARRAVHRSGDGCVRASPRGQRLLRERAGVDRCRVRRIPTTRRCACRWSRPRPIASKARCRTRPIPQFGARASYTNVDIDGRAMQMRLDGRFEVKQQLAKVAFTWPPTASKWLDTRSAWARSAPTSRTTRRRPRASSSSAAASTSARTRSIRAALLYDRQVPVGASPSSAHATYVEAGYVLRRVDDLLSPTRGFMADVRVGGGIPGVSTEGFGRVVAQTAAWYPIDRMTQLAFRAEAGAVLASSREGVPSILLFRTGGDTTVRGYEYQSLGVRLGEAIVGGRYYAIASAEAIRWINDTWGIAAFVDAGNAVDSIHDFKFALGYGLGARLANADRPVPARRRLRRGDAGVAPAFLRRADVLDMTRTSPSVPTPATALGSARRRSRWPIARASSCGAIVLALALAASWFSSESALVTLLDYAVARSGGKLAIEQAARHAARAHRDRSNRLSRRGHDGDGGGRLDRSRAAHRCSTEGSRSAS